MGATAKKSDFTFKNAEFRMEKPEQELKNHSSTDRAHYDDNSENNCAAE